jgi:hypothetical protein
VKPLANAWHAPCIHLSTNPPEHAAMFLAFLAIVIVTGASLGLAVVHALRIR